MLLTIATCNVYHPIQITPTTKLVRKREYDDYDGHDDGEDDNDDDDDDTIGNCLKDIYCTCS